MSLSPKQRGVLVGMMGALLLSVGIVAGARGWAGHMHLPPDALGPRLRYGLPFELLLVLTMTISIGALARHRFRTPEDIDGSGLTSGSDREAK